MAERPHSPDMIDMIATLLVVDDEKATSDLLVRHLKAAGYEVITAANGHEALSKARSAQPDLILLDMMLGDLDGLFICENLRGDAATRSIPVLMLTALAGELSDLQGLAGGADDYLPKPFTIAELRNRVHKLLQVRTEELLLRTADPDED